MLIHAVLFVIKQLNLFPVKGGLSSRLSPKQIMSGEVVDYTLCSMGFGRYCQIHEEDQPRNSLAARTQALSLSVPVEILKEGRNSNSDQPTTGAAKAAKAAGDKSVGDRMTACDE
jgi:hypothetical protein